MVPILVVPLCDVRREGSDHDKLGQAGTGEITSKTPVIVAEEAMDPVGELEYNTVLRRECVHTVHPLGRMSRRVILSYWFEQAISKHRGILAKLIPLRFSEIRSLNSEVVFLLTMHDLGSFRPAHRASTYMYKPM